MRLTTLLVLATAAVATFAPAASAAITAPPDQGQPGPDPATTHQWTFAGGCTAVAFRPERSRFANRGIAAAGGVWCFRRMSSVSVLTCTDIYAPNSIWPVGGLVDGSSWRPLSCTSADDATNVQHSFAVDVNAGAGCSSSPYPWWPSSPTVRTEVVTQFTTARGAVFNTVDYSRPVTIAVRGTCPTGGGGGGTGGPV
jgi:hypothetical protein